jgi:hypothetical protein
LRRQGSCDFVFLDGQKSCTTRNPLIRSNDMMSVGEGNIWQADEKGDKGRFLPPNACCKE